MKIVINRKYLFLVVLLTFQCQDCRLETTKSPVTLSCFCQNLTNTVVYEGTLNTAFGCLVIRQSVQWIVIPSSELLGFPKPITNVEDYVVSQFNSTYAVNQSQLTIFNATVAPQGPMAYPTAGLYFVKYLICTFAANFIVIRSGPTCTRDASDPNNVKLSCSVDYAESDIQPNNPIFIWRKSASVIKKEQPKLSQIGSYLKRSISQLPIASDDPTTYECQLTFSESSSTPLNYVTKTAPDFSASCYISN